MFSTIVILIFCLTADPVYGAPTTAPAPEDNELKETVLKLVERVGNLEAWKRNHVDQVDQSFISLNKTSIVQQETLVKQAETVETLVRKESKQDERLTNVTKEITDLSEKDSEQDERLTNVTKELTDLSEKDSEQDESLTKLTEEVTDLQEKVQNLEAWKRNHVDQVDQSFISLNKTSIVQQETLVMQAQTVQTLVRKESKQDEKLMRHQVKLNVLAAKDIQHDTRINDLAADDKKLQTTQLETLVKQAKKDSEQHEKLTKLTEELTDLSEKDKTIERNLTLLDDEVVKTASEIYFQLSYLDTKDRVQDDALIEHNDRLNDIATKHSQHVSRLNGLADEDKKQDSRLNELAAEDKKHDVRLNGLITKDSQQDNRIKNLAAEDKKLEATQLGSLQILKPLGSTEAPKCAFTCAGTTGRSETDWENHPIDGKVYTWVDISRCGFNNVPIITVSVVGDTEHDAMIGASAVSQPSSTKFLIHLAGYVTTNNMNQTNYPTVDTANTKHWNIMWSAYGFKSNCE